MGCKWHTYIVYTVCKETPLHDTEQLINFIGLTNDQHARLHTARESLHGSQVIGSHLLGINVLIRPLHSPIAIKAWIVLALEYLQCPVRSEPWPLGASPLSDWDACERGSCLCKGKQYTAQHACQIPDKELKDCC